jgi:hypothetical protein
MPVGSGVSGITSLAGFEPQQGELAVAGFEPQQGELAVAAFEERWTGGYIFESETQSFRSRRNRDLELTTYIYPRAARYMVTVKVIDIFGNDTMMLVPVQVG